MGDAREPVVSGLAIKIVGFRYRASMGQVELFVQMEALPDLRTADALYDRLRAQVGMPTCLILRTDSLFFSYGGPFVDPFDVPTPIVSDQDYLARPYIVCFPDRRPACATSMEH